MNGFTHFAEWKLSCAHMFPPYFDCSSTAIFELPLLSGSFFPGRDVRPNYSRGWIFNPGTTPRLFTGQRIPCPPRPERTRSKSVRRAEKGEKGEGKGSPGKGKGRSDKLASPLESRNFQRGIPGLKLYRGGKGI